MADSIPFDAHPISYTQIGESIWTQRKHHILHPGIPDLPPGHIIENTLCNPNTDTLVLGSDGSVRLADEVATCAWMMVDPEGNYAQACFLLRHINSLTSYRSELEGIYRGLRHIQHLKLSPSTIHQWCDSKSAVDNSNIDPPTPSAMIAPDADILLAIRHLRRQMAASTIVCKHVYGHQDSRPPRDLSPHQQQLPMALAVDHPRLSQEAAINIECDRMADETARFATECHNVDLPHTVENPLPGSQAGLKIGTTWITTNLADEVSRAQHSATIRDYCQLKYGWSNAVMGTIHWEVTRLAHRRGSRTQFMQSSKLMHGWLPVMHMHGHSTGVSACPGCGCPSETVDHMLLCPNPQMRQARDVAFSVFRAKCRHMDLPMMFFTDITGYLKSVLCGLPAPEASSALLSLTFRQQEAIGPVMILRGFLAKGWSVALLRMNTQLPLQTMAKILRLIWDDIVAPIWHVRNDILHKNENHLITKEFDDLGLRLHWFRLRRRDVLSFRDQFLVNYDQSDVEGMTHVFRRALVAHLEVALQAYATERSQVTTRQNVITRYFQRRVP